MKRLALSLLASLALPALADRLPLPADTPASYKAECGSCHLPYPPALLVASDWKILLAGLKNHFGSDAELDAGQQRAIASFLEYHAGNPNRLGMTAGKTPRISQTTWFIRKHREIPARLWHDARIKSAANCEACHTRAGEGRYSEHEMAIPELRGR